MDITASALGTAKTETAKPRNGTQSIYAPDGTELFAGEWNPRCIFSTITPDPSFWRGKTVLEIAANTGGLSVEMARAGASVTMTEPSKNTLDLSRSTVEQIAKDEYLDLKIQELDFFQCRQLPKHDVIVCLGLIYHFRHPQLMLDMLSEMNPTYLFISTQNHPSPDFALFNRKSPGIMPENFWRDDAPLTGWHPTRALFERMLQWSGFGEIESLTTTDFPKKNPGLTNSAYYKAKLLKPVNVDAEMKRYYPR